MLKRTNSNISTVYTFKPLDILIHEVLVHCASIAGGLYAKRTNSNILYGYSKNTTNILIHNKKNYAYSSEMTLVRPFLNNSMLCINHI